MNNASTLVHGLGRPFRYADDLCQVFSGFLIDGREGPLRLSELDLSASRGYNCPQCAFVCAGRTHSEVGTRKAHSPVDRSPLGGEGLGRIR